MHRDEQMQLGCMPSLRDRRTLRLSRYFTPAMATPPPATNWRQKVPTWSLGGNNKYGNCVVVTAANLLHNWAFNTAKLTANITDAAIIDLSRQMGALRGYNILERLKWWRTTGMWAHRIKAFASVENTDDSVIRVAIHEFGACDIALDLPKAWQNQDVWDVGHGWTYRPNSWGTHSVPIVDYDETYYYVATWGRLQKLTPTALHAYCPERYAVISEDWFTAQQVTPSGFDINALEADLQQVSS